MKAKAETIELWTCPKCGRQFERQGQTHSCRIFPIGKHFEGKPAGKKLYEEFKLAIKKQMGSFKIESLECCIHFVSTFTFAAIKVFKDKIQVDFSLSRKLVNNRIIQFVPMSAHRYLYFINIFTENEIDGELIKWIKEAHDKKNEKTQTA